jgi:hypothetical protein
MSGIKHKILKGDENLRPVCPKKVSSKNEFSGAKNSFLAKTFLGALFTKMKFTFLKSV